MRSSNLAIVFVDIAGFTERTSHQSRKESEAWLRRYEELLIPLVRAFGGQKIKSIGDAYLCSFVSPTNALLFGMAAQDRLFAHNQTVPEAERIEIRVAVNVGEVREMRRDVFGEPVNIAARVEGIAPVGEIWFTEAVYLAMTKSEVPSEEVGFRELKGIREPVRLYRIPRGSDYRLLGQEVSAAPTTTSSPRNGGPEITSFPFGGIGLKRAEERGWVMSLADLQGRLAHAGSDAVVALGGLAGRLRFIPRGLGRLRDRLRRWPFWARLALPVGILALLLFWLLWPNDPFDDVRDALNAGNVDRALFLLQKHPQPDLPDAKVLRARALLRKPSPECSAAATILQEALSKTPSLFSEPEVVADLVSALDRREAAATIDFIAERAGQAAVPRLTAASRDKRYWLRWNSIRTLKKLGAEKQVDLPLAYIQDLRYGGSCSLRKTAARKLAELKDERSLQSLREAKDRGFFDNLCMGDALDDAIRAIEKK